MTDWHASAVCAQVGSEPFFPDTGGSTVQARKTCWGCPVRLECLTEGLAEGDIHSIRAGLVMSELLYEHRLVRKGIAPARVAETILRRISEQARNRPAVRPGSRRAYRGDRRVHAA